MSLQDALIFTDHKHQIIDVNDPVTHYIGYTQEELVGKPIDQILICDFDIKDLLGSISRQQAIINEIWRSHYKP